MHRSPSIPANRRVAVLEYTAGNCAAVGNTSDMNGRYKAAALSSTFEAPVTSTTTTVAPTDTTVADPTLAVDGEVVVTFGGFTPFEFIQLIVASTPQVIGSG